MMEVELDYLFKRERFADLPLENIDLIIDNIPIKDKKLFTIANTGIQNIKFLNRDPKKIDSVDNDEDQIILNYLILSGIENLDEIEFKKLFINSPELKREKKYDFFFDLVKFGLMLSIPFQYRKKAEEIIKEKYRLGDVKELTKDEKKKNYDWLKDFVKLKEYIRKGKIGLYHGDVLEFIDNDKYDVIFLSNIRDVISNFNKEYYKRYDELLLNKIIENTSDGAYVYLTEYKDNLSKEDSLSNPNNFWLGDFDIIKTEEEETRFDITHYLLKKIEFPF